MAPFQDSPIWVWLGCQWFGPSSPPKARSWKQKDLHWQGDDNFPPLARQTSFPRQCAKQNQSVQPWRTGETEFDFLRMSKSHQSQITNEHRTPCLFPLTRCLQKSTSDMQRNVDKPKPFTRMHSDACIVQPSLSLTHPLDGSCGASLESGQSAATCIVQCRWPHPGCIAPGPTLAKFGDWTLVQVSHGPCLLNRSTVGLLQLHFHDWAVGHSCSYRQVLLEWWTWRRWKFADLCLFPAINVHTSPHLLCSCRMG